MWARLALIAFCIASAAVLFFGAERTISPEGQPARAPSFSSRTGEGLASQYLILNRLGEASSPYLRAAALQPVSWQPFDVQSLELAGRLGRPILLDIGGTWCHWCDVMAAESYEDKAIAALINENFLPLKVDADERPDLDRRYQRSAQLIAGQAGWPLTLFLTPKGDAFAGGTYFPARGDLGLPTFKNVLEEITGAFNGQIEAIDQRALAISNDASTLGNAGVVRGQLSNDLVRRIGESILSVVDEEFGGLGTSAKAPPTQAINLALHLYLRTNDQRFLNMAARTLDAMAVGAVRDQLTGAFFRYSLERSWNTPNFEIVASLNGAIALSYLRAYEITGDARFRAVGEKTIDFLHRFMWDDSHGGFYSSMGGDSSKGAGLGRYYTWTANEISAALPPDEAAAASLYYGIDGTATEHGDSLSNRASLRAAKPVSEVAQQLGLQPDEARGKLEGARSHLLMARGARAAPVIDHSLYVDRNSFLVSNLLEAARILNRGDLRDRALSALARVNSLASGGKLLAHSYPNDGPDFPALLDDQMAMAGAMLDAFHSTQNRSYLDDARTLIDATVNALRDPQSGSFFEGGGIESDGLAPIAPFDDGMTMGGNPLAAIVLDRYSRLADAKAYSDRAGSVLAAFAGAASEYGPFASGYGLAVAQHLDGR